MDVLAISAPPAAAGPTARGDAANEAGPGAFAEVLGQSLQRADAAQEQPAGTTTRPARAGAPGLQDPAERETLEADALPLIAAALESRALARASGEAAAAKPGTTATPAGVQAETSAVRAWPSAADADASPAAPSAEAQDEAAPLLSAATGDDDRLPAAQAPVREPQGPAAPLANVPAATAPARTTPPAAGLAPALPASAAQAAASAAPRSDAVAAGTLQQEIAVPGEAAPAAAGSETPVAGMGTTTVSATGTQSAAPAAAPAAPAQGYVAPPVASRAWGTALGHEVARLHHAGHGQAQLELNPPGLGPLSVSLSVADQQAQALFVSPHPAVRAAVEAALPQLRSALADQGISLGQASVGAEHQSGSGAFAQSAQDQAAQRRPMAAAFAAQEPSAAPAVPAPRAGGHMLDTFA